MLDIKLRPRAQLDLESTYIHVAVVLKSPHAADKLLERLYEAFERLAEFPDIGKNLEDSELSRPYRQFLCGSSWICYTHDENALTIWRIFHTSQDIDDYTYLDL